MEEDRESYPSSTAEEMEGDKCGRPIDEVVRDEECGEICPSFPAEEMEGVDEDKEECNGSAPSSPVEVIEGDKMDERREDHGKNNLLVEEMEGDEEEMGEYDENSPLVEEMEGGEDGKGEEKKEQDRPASSTLKIDNILEDAAHRINLSVLNVKSILRHVLKDKRVLALAQKKAAEEEGKVSGQQWDMEEIVTYEPKLTRSHVRQELMGSGGISAEKIASLTKIAKMKSPVKKTEGSAGILLDESIITDDSSDEEYNPVIDSSNEDSDGQEDSGSHGDSENSSDEDSEEEDREVEEEEEDKEEVEEEGEDKEEVGEVEEDIEEVEKEEEDEEEVEKEEADENACEKGVTEEVDTDLQQADLQQGRKIMSAEKTGLVLLKSSQTSSVPGASSKELQISGTVCEKGAATTPLSTGTLPITESVFTTPSTSITETIPKISSQVLPNTIMPSYPNITSGSIYQQFPSPVDSSRPAISHPSSPRSPIHISLGLPTTASITPTIPSAPAIITNTLVTHTSSVTAITSSSSSFSSSSSSNLASSSTTFITSASGNSTYSGLPGISLLPDPNCLPPPPKPSSSSLMPPPDNALIHETAALLASLSDMIQSPMKSLHCPTSVEASPLKSLHCPTTTVETPLVLQEKPPLHCPTTVEASPLKSLYCPPTTVEIPPVLQEKPQLHCPTTVEVSPLKSLYCPPTTVEAPPILQEKPPLHCPTTVEALPPPSLPYEEEMQEGEIAQRTRSKLPLNDTSISAIEAAFFPPDVDDPLTPRDLEPMELEEDDLEWQKWLSDLFNPNTPVNPNDSFVSGGGGEEDGDDTEYNYLADQQLDEEKEEFRDDRAVRISKKEVDDLLNEYLYPSAGGIGGLLSPDGVDLTSAYLLQSLGLQSLLLQNAAPVQQSAPESTGSLIGSKFPTNLQQPLQQQGTQDYLTVDQTVQLHTQIQQHYQLLMQTFVLSRFEPSLVHVSQLAAQAVEELDKLRQDALDSGDDVQSRLWGIPTINEGLEIISKLDPHNSDAVKLVAASGTPVRIPESAQEVLMNHETFWTFPHFLPAIGFGSAKDKQLNSNYTTEEDYLLVMGMDHYGSVKAWSQIQQRLLPIKTEKQLRLRVKNASSKRAGDNVIKHYKRTKEVKIPFKEDGESKHRSDLLPDWVLTYHKKRVEREKKEAKKKEKQLEQNRKISKILDPYINRLIVPVASDSHGVSDKTSDQLALKFKVKPSVGSSLQSRAEQETLITSLTGRALCSKRNLSKSFGIKAGEVKRRKLHMSPKGEVHKQGKQSRKSVETMDTYQSSFDGGDDLLQSPTKADAKQTSSLEEECEAINLLSECSMEQLLHAAGLEATCYSSRYAYKYLNEVKACLIGKDGEKTYSEFLDILVRAGKEKMKPSIIYKEMKKILHPWPHLLKLFTEFLRPKDCIRANVMKEKYEVESVKSFISLLKEKFKDSPLKIGEVIDKLLSLDTPGITRKEIKAALLPLINAHEDLVMELKRFLYQLAPPPRPDDIYEEISLVETNSEQEWDKFEEISLIDPPKDKSDTGEASKVTAAIAPSKQTTAQQSATALSKQVSPQQSQLGKASTSKHLPKKASVAQSSVGRNRSSHGISSSGILHKGGSSAKGKNKLIPKSGDQDVKVPLSKPAVVRSQKSSQLALRTNPVTLQKNPPVGGADSNKSPSTFRGSQIPDKETLPSKVIPSLVVSSSETSADENQSKLIHGSPSVPAEKEKIKTPSILVTSPVSTQSKSSQKTVGHHSPMDTESTVCDSLPASMIGEEATLSLKSVQSDSMLRCSSASIAEVSQGVTKPVYREGALSTPMAEESALSLHRIQREPYSSSGSASNQVLVTPLLPSSVQSVEPKVVFSSSTAEEVPSLPTKGMGQPSPQVTAAAREPNKWTREEDKVILKRYLHENLKPPKDDGYFRDIALQLNRKPEEVNSRYRELFELFQSSKAKQQSLKT